jgi:hypothetical protein
MMEAALDEHKIAEALVDADREREVGQCLQIQSSCRKTDGPDAFGNVTQLVTNGMVRRLLTSASRRY